MARVHYGRGISSWTIRETHLQTNSCRASESFIEKPCVLSELPTELEAPRQSPELTVSTVLKTETVGYVNITSNWISEIQLCF